MCFCYFNSLCEAWLTRYMRFKGEGIRSRRVVMLVEISMAENPLISLTLYPTKY